MDAVLLAQEVGDLLIGNEADGMINAFNAVTGDFLGTISGVSGPLVNEGLWAIATRASGTSFDPDALYFVAGINDEQNGLFGKIEAIPEPATVSTAALAIAAFAFARVMRNRRC